MGARQAGKTVACDRWHSRRFTEPPDELFGFNTAFTAPRKHNILLFMYNMNLTDYRCVAVRHLAGSGPDNACKPSPTLILEQNDAYLCLQMYAMRTYPRHDAKNE